MLSLVNPSKVKLFAGNFSIEADGAKGRRRLGLMTRVQISEMLKDFS
jgi:hypothetical protein